MTDNKVCEDDEHDFDGHVECVVCGRSGLDGAWDQIDKETRAEIQIVWQPIVERSLR